MSVFTFISRHDASEHCIGSVISYTPGTDGETDILDDLQDLGALMTYIASQFPHGWRIEDGKVVGEDIKCFVCEESHPVEDMAEFLADNDSLSPAIHMCPGCRDIHWKEYS